MAKLRIVLAIFLGSIALVRADDAVARAQQALKDQGFYYGEITGEKNADTTAAVRRYQIRNGLHVSGELDNDTLHALVAEASSSTQPIAKASPPARPQPSDESSRESETEKESPVRPYQSEPQDNGLNRAPPEPFSGRPQDRQSYPSGPAAIVPPNGGLFAGTPYEMAPPEVQRNIVASAQSILARHDLYRGEIDGVYGSAMEFSLRAYQARIGLTVTGRLDLETLAGLDLLPGRRAPIVPSRRRIVRPLPEEPVRGEWIPE